MNKTIVKIFALMLAVVLLAVPVFAGGDQPNLPEEHEHEVVVETKDEHNHTVIVEAPVESAEIQPRYTSCSNCGGSMSLYSSKTGSWETVSYTLCQYGWMDHTDKVQEKVTTIKYKCADCGVIDTEYYTETRQICQ